MLFGAFIGASYQAAARTADDEECINWYPEKIQAPGAPFQTILLPTPGVETLSSLVRQSPSLRGTPGRAHFAIAGREFAVIGDTFVEIDAAGRQTQYKVWNQANQDYTDVLAYDTNPATICSNGDAGNQLLITSGGHAYYFWLTNNTMFEVADLAGKATMGAFLEGYFLVLDAATSTIYVSALENGATWDTSGTGWAQRSLQADRWLSMIVCGRFLWLLGETTSECWYNSGATFPFSMHPSGAVGYGVAAPWSPRLMGPDAVWVARTASGRKCVVKASGFTPQIISTYPIETQWQTYDTIEDAIGDSYSERGHAFYLVHLDRHDVTWAWDSETGMWSKRGTWLRDEGRYVAWRPRYYAYAYNEHRMLDGGGDTLYRLSSDLATDVDGEGIRRVRRAPALNNENKRVYYSRFELEMERAQATSAIVDPQVMFRQSNDGGKTWHPERWRSAGKIGEHAHRVFWNQLGTARRRVFEVSVSDPVQWKLVGAYLEAGNG